MSKASKNLGKVLGSTQGRERLEKTRWYRIMAWLILMSNEALYSSVISIALDMVSSEAFDLENG